MHHWRIDWSGEGQWVKTSIPRPFVSFQISANALTFKDWIQKKCLPAFSSRRWMQTHCRRKVFSKTACTRHSAYDSSVSRWSHIATPCVLFPWCFFSPQTGGTVMLMELNRLFLPAFRAVAPPPPNTVSAQQIAPNGHGLMLTTTAKMSWNEIMQFAAEKDNRSTKRDILSSHSCVTRNCPENSDDPIML